MSAVSPSEILAVIEKDPVPPTAPVSFCGCVSTDIDLETVN